MEGRLHKASFFFYHRPMNMDLGEIRNVAGELLDYTLHPGSDTNRQVVIIGHGVTGNKDRPLIVALAENLSAHGIHALRFSFSGNGNSEGRFEESCISKEVEDLSCVLDALNDCEIAYAGHSMGAAVGVLRASMDNRIQKLISLAGMVHTKAFAEREFGGETPGAGLMWEKPECPLSSAYMNDMATISSVQHLASSIHVPWLLVHGTEDDVVPLQDSLDVQSNQPSAELFRIEGADHIFEGEPTRLMVDKVTQWLKA
jgi:alpha/beta superfamily hydrolase